MALCFTPFCSDSNKARQRIVSKIQKEKQKLGEAIELYNQLVADGEAVGSVDTVLAAELWPWDNGMILCSLQSTCMYV